MIYDIQSKSDFLTGASLIVRIAEDDLDRNALNTILYDKPEFILPFRYRSIDGEVEFIYQIGQLSKLQYLSGSRSPKEYAGLWTNMLGPLLECGDWFMRPFSFLLDAGYLYCEKGKGTISYVYIPSVRDCCAQINLKEMAAEVSRLVSVSDTNLENKVLRAIMKDFDPNGLLKLLKTYDVDGISERQSRPVNEPRHVPGISQNIQSLVPVNIRKPAAPPLLEAKGRVYQGAAWNTPGDIVINLPASGRAPGKPAEGGKEKNKAGSKKEKGKLQDSIMNLLRGKKEQLEVYPQAADMHSIPQMPRNRRFPGYEPPQNGPPYNEPPYYETRIPGEVAGTSGDTLLHADITSGIRLRLISGADLPPVIDVNTAEGGVFTIGRFDAAAGRRQCCFEFDKKTKAVSRRHAAIELIADRYSIVDLSSSAGTFLNGEKLPPSTPFELCCGSRISFGNAGADYVWEQ